MKEMAAFVLLIVLIGVGWNQPYNAHFSSVVGEPPPVIVAPAAAAPDAASAPAAPATAPAAATPARDTSWLWKKTSMDGPQPSDGGKEGGKHAR